MTAQAVRVTNEEQSRTRCGLTGGRNWLTLTVKGLSGVEQEIESCREAGCRNNRIEGLRPTVRIHGLRGSQAGQCRPDLQHPPLKDVDDANVDHGHAAARIRSPIWPAPAVSRQITEHHARGDFGNTVR